MVIIDGLQQILFMTLINLITNGAVLIEERIVSFTPIRLVSSFSFAVRIVLERNRAIRGDYCMLCFRVFVVVD